MLNTDLEVAFKVRMFYLKVRCKFHNCTVWNIFKNMIFIFHCLMYRIRTMKCMFHTMKCRMKRAVCLSCPGEHGIVAELGVITFP